MANQTTEQTETMNTLMLRGRAERSAAFHTAFNSLGGIIRNRFNRTPKGRYSALNG